MSDPDVEPIPQPQVSFDQALLNEWATGYASGMLTRMVMSEDIPSAVAEQWISMHITTLVAAGLALAGALVVLRWMPGRPRTAEAPAEAELAIMEQEMLQTAEREG